MRHTKLLLLSLVIILSGSLLAHYIHTDGGRVDIQDLRFTAADGATMSALLYIPLDASRESPAPGVLAIHGYINSRETQSGFAIELARRGFVVLALDQRGHGYSAPPAFAEAFGALDGLNYLRSLAFVDKERIGLEGHSMGGWASRVATQLAPDSYRSIVMEGASAAAVPGLGDFSGSPEQPRNLAIVFSLYDEFSRFMWEGAMPGELPDAPQLKQLFGTEETIERGRIYGSVADGTARILHQPATTHPGDHISPEAILAAVHWLQLTLEHDSQIADDSHIFQWKEVGTLIALLGLILSIFPVLTSLSRLPFFAGLRESLPPNHGERGIGWWVSACLALLIPALSYYWLLNLGQSLIPASGLFPQGITNGIAFWALSNGLLSAILLASAYFAFGRKRSTGSDHFGFDAGIRNILLTAILALATVAIIYAIAALAGWLLTVDFRFWVVALKLMSPTQLQIFLYYLPGFVLFFLVFSATFNGPLRRSSASGHDDNPGKAMAINGFIACGGFIGLLLLEYTTLFSTGELLFGEPLLTIVAIQFVPLLAIAACISTFCFRLTGRSYLGAFVNALLVTWYIVAGQATHIAV
ncbi:MAG: alpha/beta fold hydrolase [Cellvibrionaceae bacterium]